jgi:hypothetical protein
MSIESANQHHLLASLSQAAWIGFDGGFAREISLNEK